MASEKIDVRVPTELLEFARGLIDGQDFGCFDDVIIEALYRFRPFIEEEKRRREWLKPGIQKGVDSADRGECVDGPKFMEELVSRTPQHH